MTLRGLVLRLKCALAAFLSDATAVQPPGPYVPNPDRIVGLTSDLSIQSTARLIVEPGPSAAGGRIVLGRGIYLGRFVEVATGEEGLLTIGDDTSIQDYSVIIGDVRIGSHCLFSLNTHVTSSTHHIHHRPPWLIRDQDRAADTLQPRVGSRSWPVVIEDDCWIGWGAVILSGVYVGRGAVIGANSVVTRDVPPYEIHAGAPNLRVNRRLTFSPPTRIDALDDECIPYFYRGFQASQSALARTRGSGVIAAASEACIVLARSDHSRLRITGQRLDNRNDCLTLALRVDGIDCGRHAIKETDFAIDVALPGDTTEGTNSIPTVLRSYRYIEIECATEAIRQPTDGSDAGCRYGIRTVSLLLNDEITAGEQSASVPRLVVQ